MTGEGPDVFLVLACVVSLALTIEFFHVGWLVARIRDDIHGLRSAVDTALKGSTLPSGRLGPQPDRIHPPSVSYQPPRSHESGHGSPHPSGPRPHTTRRLLLALVMLAALTLLTICGLLCRPLIPR
jgi:hypothetical protein